MTQFRFMLYNPYCFDFCCIIYVKRSKTTKAPSYIKEKNMIKTFY